MRENPWQGAPPATTSTVRLPRPARSLISSPDKSLIDWGKTAHLGKLNLCIAAWIGSTSTAATTSKPACSNPRLKPPAPENRSTAIGLLTRAPVVYFFSGYSDDLKRSLAYA